MLFTVFGEFNAVLENSEQIINSCNSASRVKSLTRIGENVLRFGEFFLAMLNWLFIILQCIYQFQTAHAHFAAHIPIDW